MQNNKSEEKTTTSQEASHELISPVIKRLLEDFSNQQKQFMLDDQLRYEKLMANLGGIEEVLQDFSELQPKNDELIMSKMRKIEYYSNLPDKKMIKIVKFPLGANAYFGQRKGFPIKGLDDLFNEDNDDFHCFCFTENEKRFLYYDPMNDYETVWNELDRQIREEKELIRTIRSEKERETNRIRNEAREKERIRQVELAKVETLRQEMLLKERERQRIEKEKEYWELRREALRIHKQQNSGFLSFFKPTKIFRNANCYRCQSFLFSSTHAECAACGWIVCTCGACGCRYMKGT